MRFSILASLASFGSVALGQLSASAVVQNINALTTKFQSLIVPAQQLTVLNAPLLALGQGPWAEVIIGFTDIITTATADATAMAAGPKVQYEGSDATSIGVAFHAFVKVHQQLLNELIGTKGFISQIPLVGAPIAAALRAIEAVVDNIANSLIDVVDASVAAGMKTDLAGLDATIGTSITVFTAPKNVI